MEKVLTALLKTLIVSIVLYLNSYDYSGKKAFGCLYWLSAVLIVIQFLLVTVLTIFFAIGAWNAWTAPNPPLQWLSLLLLTLLLLGQVLVSFQLRRLYQMTNYYKAKGLSDRNV